MKSYGRIEVRTTNIEVEKGVLSFGGVSIEMPPSGAGLTARAFGKIASNTTSPSGIRTRPRRQDAWLGEFRIGLIVFLISSFHKNVFLSCKSEIGFGTHHDY